MGEIVGLASTEQAIIGSSYIIKDMSGNFPNEEYPYDTLALFEIMFKVK